MFAKKSVVILLFALLVPFVAADITLDPLSSVTYNLGDVLSVSGTASHTADLRGYVSLDLVCDTVVTPLTTTLVALDAHVAQSFSELVTLTESATGSCHVLATLRDNNFVSLHTVEGSAFSVSNSLTGTFSTPGTSFQLGDSFVLQGDVTRLDGTPIDGMATLTYVRGTTAVMTQHVAVRDGFLDHVHTLSLLPSGDYHVDVTVTDSLGNSQAFAEAVFFSLDDQLVVFLALSRDDYLPGESVFFSGDVETRSGSVPADLLVTLGVGDETFTQQSLGASFDFEYRVPFTARAQTYNVEVVASDADGNYGTSASHYSVVQVPTSLQVDVDEFSVDPGASVSFEAVFLDQAGDLYDDSVTVTLLNPKDEQVFSSSVLSNEAHDVAFETFAAPGPWQLTVEAEDLFDDVVVTVVPKQALVTVLDGSEVTVRNVGNIAWDAPVNFDADGAIASADVSLEVNASTTVDLAKLFSDGNYTVTVVETGEVYNAVEIYTPGVFTRLGRGISKVFSGSSTGSAVVDTTSGSSGGSLGGLVFYGLVALALLGFVFFFYKKQTDGEEDTYPDYAQVYSEEDRERDRQEAKKKKAEIQSRKKREPKYKYGVASEADIKDFRNRMQKKFASENEQQQRHDYQKKNPPPKDPPSNVFSMFD